MADTTESSFNPYLVVRSGYELAHSDIRVNWVVEGAFVERCINALIGPAGNGKTTLLLNMAACVSRNVPWYGRATRQQPVYVIDYENPESRICSDSRNLDLSQVIFWDQGCVVAPPKIGTPLSEYFKQFQPGLMIIDGHRASMQGNENASDDTAIAMAGWRELTRLGFTIILIHHTKKDDPRIFRGSQAFIDQLDHPVYFYSVAEPGSIEPVNADDYDDCLFYLGTGIKTRFSAVRNYVRRAGLGQFQLIGDPDVDRMNHMVEILTDTGPIVQLEFEAHTRSLIETGRNKARALMKRGIRDGLWITQSGPNRSIIYSLPVRQSAGSRPPYRGGGEPDNRTGSGSPVGFTENQVENRTNIGFAGLPGGNGEVANPTGIVSLIPSDSTGVMP